MLAKVWRTDDFFLIVINCVRGKLSLPRPRKTLQPMNLQDIAKEVLEVLGTGRQLDPFSKVYPDFGLKDAYNVTAAVRAQREEIGRASCRKEC